MLSMCVMDIMNVLRTGMNMSISHIFMYGYLTTRSYDYLLRIVIIIIISNLEP